MSPVEAIRTVPNVAGPPVPVERMAVLLIDVQETALVDEPRHQTEIGYMLDVLRQANARGVTVFEINYQRNTEGGRMRPTIPELAAARTPAWELVSKPEWSAFEETDLHQRLQAAGVTTLIVMGYEQTACVRETVIDARELGYQVHTSMSVVQGFVRESERRYWEENGRPLEREYGEQAMVWDFSGILEFYRDHTVLAGDYRQLPVFHPSAASGRAPCGAGAPTGVRGLAVPSCRLPGLGPR